MYKLTVRVRMAPNESSQVTEAQMSLTAERAATDVRYINASGTDATKGNRIKPTRTHKMPITVIRYSEI